MYYLTLLLVLMISCGGGASGSVATTTNTKNVKEVNLIKSVSPAQKTKFLQGDNIDIGFEHIAKYDSARLYVDGMHMNLPMSSNHWKIVTDSQTSVGVKNIRVELFSGGESQSKSTNIIVLPSAKQTNYTIKIIKSYPHSTSAYTQGLEFYDGNLYESSGQYGSSYLSVLLFPSMKEIKRVNLDMKYFAEGITFLQDKLYQLTWQENKVLVYDPKTLDKIDEKSISTQGWGLTTDGVDIYLSDGSSYIYIIDPANFTIKRKIQTYSSLGELNSINEMEWIDGKIWANIYGYDYIVIINPQTGAVEGVIDSSSLLAQSDISSQTDVLNGIARDHKSGKIYITGKNWPKLFEVEIVK